MHALTADDHALVRAASDLLVRAYDDRNHRVAAAVRGASGEVHLGLHLASTRVNICAEPSAIANARMAGENGLDTIVAVGMGADGLPKVINPCGVCRELVPHYGEGLRVIVDDAGEIGVIAPADLLPIPWVRAQSYDN
ncbi:cytidine deaminase family protein [Microbacterium abyssi]|uniref:cytidine deaminase family protein n=1 Tax=Microbacterium abyssi TaxID=2782166 RepID=UPI001887CAF0|nr:cytidine deaminase [Microbacterium sp. A18JL241]